MQRRNFLAGLGALGTLASAAWAADPLIKLPMRLIVLASPGGFTDVAARLIAERLSARVGQPLVVDNRAGASGIIGAEAAARSAPVEHWYAYLNDPTLADAILDRIVHGSHRLALNGESLRKKATASTTKK